MATAMTTLKRWQDEYMKFTARVEKPVLEMTGRFTEAVERYVPERPEWAFLEQVPTLTEFVESQLKFRTRVVDEQAAFIRKVMKELRPVLVKLEHKPIVRRVQDQPIVRRVPAKRVPAKRGPARSVKAA